MKRFAFSLLLTLLIVYAFSQSPQGITHQAGKPELAKVK